ncbi:hypothetical protein S7711_05036 [Stachybotrys chartarum IBT 7711]|uniref:Uncharacterized protein n=1 Tax=Stachybotrys chartarum (strain CBS 109288 / IBT 7711) TaxID=1280523 RepID=A0A084BAM6_STACB|nr:hypothetical protein S7711_05036 [Stachybotrys chartarum IBT 7711]KFA79215.1 hypothetical protein S40288_02372 [Stachybotrys chartarum IBT 40288]
MLSHHSFAASLLVWSALAQNNTDEANCPRAIEDLADDHLTFNSTGTTAVAFLGQDLWHLSLAYEFRLARNTSVVRDTSSWANQYTFLSVPESLFDSNDSDEFQICYYQLDGINATSDSDASDSCNGVLSEECRDAILEAPLPTDGSCPSVTISNDCGGPARLWTSAPFNFSRPECTVDSLPDAVLPNDYRTLQAMYQGLPISTEEETFYEAYDLLVRQSLPVLLTARIPGVTSNTTTALACLSANEIVDGSREPEGEFPPSSAATLGTSRAMVYSLALVTVVGYVLAF